MILTGSAGVFVNNAGEVDITHQLDFDVGFNLAPDYAGAGFSSELNDLKEGVENLESQDGDVANIGRGAKSDKADRKTRKSA